MELEIQKYLRNGHTLEDLVAEYAIETRICESLGVVSLNYSQIASPMAEIISQECRALILELNTWNVVSRSFFKFFNAQEELAANIDWSTARVSEKVDGSLCPWYFYNGQWHCATKGTADASGPCGTENFTFKDLILLTLKDMGFTFESFTQYLDPNTYYSFELCSFENMVIIPYEKRELVWLAAWDKNTLQELDINTMLLQVPVRKPNQFPAQTIGELIEAAKQIEKFTLEGFVVCDAQQNRIKIKSPSYLAADRVMSRLATPKRLIEFVVMPNYDDVYAILPPYKQEQVAKIHEQVRVLVNEINAVFERLKPLGGNRKDFAIEATKTKYSSYLFQLLDGKDNETVLQKMSPDTIASWIGLK